MDDESLENSMSMSSGGRLVDRVSHEKIEPLTPQARIRLLKSVGAKVLDESERISLNAIRQSRTRVGCKCAPRNCLPSKCPCALNGIPCQMDHAAFPCSCRRANCFNHYGRVEFSEARVKMHANHVLSRINCPSLSAEPTSFLTTNGFHHHDESARDAHVFDPINSNDKGACILCLQQHQSTQNLVEFPPKSSLAQYPDQLTLDIDSSTINLTPQRQTTITVKYVQKLTQQSGTPIVCARNALTSAPIVQAKTRCGPITQLLANHFASIQKQQQEAGYVPVSPQLANGGCRVISTTSLHRLSLRKRRIEKTPVSSPTKTSKPFISSSLMRSHDTTSNSKRDNELAPKKGCQVWPPPDALIDDEGYPMTMDDYLDDSQLIDNFNRLQLRIKDHLKAMRTGINVPLPPSAENRLAQTQGKLSAKSRLESRMSNCVAETCKNVGLPLFPIIGPGMCQATSYDQLTSKYLGLRSPSALTCPTLPSSPKQPQLSSCCKAKKKLKSPPQSSCDQDVNLSRIYALGAGLTRQICSKSNSEKEKGESCKASSSTSSGCESTPENGENSDLSAALTAELLPWYNDQLTTLAHGLTSHYGMSEQPMIYNGRTLRTEAQVSALLRAFFQAGLVMGRVHALRKMRGDESSRTSTPVLESKAPVEPKNTAPASATKKQTSKAKKGKGKK
ncbi:cysteine-serine-rich nuclear protein [Cichlidogyrus casuarinus]|uniref:Cysteine-serine-rich nuclear protein n=1 Tax=Cichlidogyrus casuarinus TaxID=1844966 RepID=A0ABD2QKD7_9PLAT